MLEFPFSPRQRSLERMWQKNLIMGKRFYAILKRTIDSERERGPKRGWQQQKREPQKCAFALNFNMGDMGKNYCEGNCSFSTIDIGAAFYPTGQ